MPPRPIFAPRRACRSTRRPFLARSRGPPPAPGSSYRNSPTPTLSRMPSWPRPTRTTTTSLLSLRRSAKRWPSRRPRTRKLSTPTTTVRMRRGTCSSTCCSAKPAGHSVTPATVSSRSPVCPGLRGRSGTTPETGSSTTFSGEKTVCRLRSWRPSAPRVTRGWVRSRPGFTLMPSSASSVSAPSSSTATGMSTTSGMTPSTRRDRSPGSTPGTSSPYWCSGERRSIRS